jgi:outer membrane protein OmpA-like peptidoglycan-associated protein
MTLPPWRLIVVLALFTGCRQEPSRPSTSAPPDRAAAILADDCQQTPGPTNEELEAQSEAIVPLKPGLTLSTTWHRATEGDDVECLTQIHDVDGVTIAATANCSMSTGTEGGSRRTCRADMRSGYMYYTGAGDEPDILRGTTMFNLSTSAFNELKSKGTTRHRYLSVLDGAIVGDLDGALQRESTGKLSVIVNDRVVELPVVRAAGRLTGTAMGKPVETRVTAAVVDDGRFPLVLDYALPDVGSAGFSVRYSKISFPTGGKLEQQLASDERIDVYGIYFDVDSDRIRTESNPVLRELADALQRNAQWQVTINGHTDAIGSAESNMDLSRRRSEAVRAALVERYGVAAARLSTHGYGGTVPKDTNETAEGRARNRRVELVRQ